MLKPPDMALDRPALGNDQAARRDQIFAKLGFKVLAVLHLFGVKGIFQLDDEP